jgi:glycosyltransferase involved in cell wall biosynthesis
MAGALASSFTLPRPPSVIYNGRTRPPFQYRPRKRQAVTAGRLWDEAKNIALLAAVHSPMPLLVVGEMAYNGVTFDRGLANLSLLGTLSPRELFTLFYESAIYICTSRYEPFGLAPLEAALCGCAVLAFDIPSMREVWGPAALYFDSPNSLTSLLRRLDAEPPLLADAQQRSAARASFFAAERMVDSYHLLFQQALARSEDAVNAA